METSIQRIKKEIEMKRKHNEETLKLLKEKSLIYNAEKEKQKRYFLNKSSSLLSKKRKHSNNENNSKEEEISNNINDYDENNDYDDYIDDDINNSFFSNRTFTNLNFCRPERFSFRKDKKKLSIKNEQEFTINKTIKPKPISKYSNVSLTLSHSSNIKEESKNNEIKNNIGLGLFSNNQSNINLNTNLEQNKGLFSDKKEKIEIKQQGSLFGFNVTPNPDNNAINTKSLFSSNITDENKKEEKNKIIKEEKKDIDNSNTNLFGDINRFNKIGEGKSLFGVPSTQKDSDKLKINENPIEKEKISSPKKDNINIKGESPKKDSLFNINNKSTEKENKPLFEEKKEKISMPLFGVGNNNNDNKNKNITNKNKESEDKKNNGSLFGDGLSKLQEKKEEQKNNNNLFGFKLIEKDAKKEENEKTKEKNSLFGNILKEEDQEKKNNFSLFKTGNGNNLFGNQEQKKDKGNEEKEEKKEKITFGLFNNNNNNDKNEDKNKSVIPAPSTPLFSEVKNKEEDKIKNDNNSLLFNNSSEVQKPNSIFNSALSKGSLASDSNPFLNPTKPVNNLPNIFSASNLSNTNNVSNISNTNPNISIFNSNPNFLNNKSDNKTFEFGTQSMESGGMEMSPQTKSRNLFENNLGTKTNFLFGNGNNNGSQTTTNIFGAPINNSNSIFNNSNSIFGNSSNILFGQKSAFSSDNKPFSGGFKFSMGKK